MLPFFSFLSLFQLPLFFPLFLSLSLLGGGGFHSSLSLFTTSLSLLGAATLSLFITSIFFSFLGVATLFLFICYQSLFLGSFHSSSLSLFTTPLFLTFSLLVITTLLSLLPTYLSLFLSLKLLLSYLFFFSLCWYFPYFFLLIVNYLCFFFLLGKHPLFPPPIVNSFSLFTVTTLFPVIIKCLSFFLLVASILWFSLFLTPVAPLHSSLCFPPYSPHLHNDLFLISCPLLSL